MKKHLSLMLVLVLCALCLTGFAEETDKIVTINLKTATDEELADILDELKAEQRSRLKTAIHLDITEVTLNKGASQRITATIEDVPEGMTAGKFVWSTSDETVATCNNGTIRATGAGQAIITCTSTLSDGTDIIANVSVTGLIPVQSVNLTSNRMEVMVDDVFLPDVVIKPEDASNKEVTYSSSDEQIIQVKEGNLVAISEGKATVTATAADGSGKAVRLNVTVTRKIGKCNDELTFLGFEWGTDFKEIKRKLEAEGIIDQNEYLNPWVSNLYYFWPEKDLQFAVYDAWRGLPVIFLDQEKGAYQLSIQPKKKVGGYTPEDSYFYFLNSIDSAGKLNEEKKELCGIYFGFDNRHERGAEIFVDLLSKMEAQYGEFSKYLSNDLKNYYKDIYEIIKDSMKDAKLFRYNDLTKEMGNDTFMDFCAFCTMKGKNNTGIMLMVDSIENVYLFYGKTDNMENIKAIQEILEGSKESKDDLGI